MILHPHTYTFLTSPSSLSCTHPVQSPLACLLIPKLACHAPSSGLCHLNFSNKVLHMLRMLLTQIFSPPHLLHVFIKCHLLRKAFPNHPTLHCTLLYFLPSTSHHQTQDTHVVVVVVIINLVYSCVPQKNVQGTFQFTPISPATAAIPAYDTSSVNIGLMNELVSTHK